STPTSALLERRQQRGSGPDRLQFATGERVVADPSVSGQPWRLRPRSGQVDIPLAVSRLLVTKIAEIDRHPGRPERLVGQLARSRRAESPLPGLLGSSRGETRADALHLDLAGVRGEIHLLDSHVLDCSLPADLQQEVNDAFPSHAQDIVWKL